MAKRIKRVLRARKEGREDDSLLVKSAESLGRVIGSLQRQLQGTSKRASAIADDAMQALPEMPRLDTIFGDTVRSRRKPGSARPSQRTSASKSSARARGARKASASSKTSRPRTGSRTSSKKR